VIDADLYKSITMQQLIRFNPFHQVHQGLRALLYHASLTVQHTDFCNTYHTGATLSLLEDLIDIFEGHAHAEDSLLFPWISGHAPHVVEHFEQQHEADHQLGQALFHAMEQTSKAESSVEKISAGIKLQQALGEFTAFNLTHMNQEETVVLPIIWQHYNDEEILVKQMGITNSFSQEKKERMGYWMLKGMNEQEIVSWYESIQKNAPAPVFNRFMQLAAAALQPNLFRKLSEIMMGSYVAVPDQTHLREVCTPV
jgi:hemerythrin-like domain-containing protein